jgi:aspartyl-tRNA(Asn)/glutamyl-tRNA(Gln) amidotransferase subunit C
MITADDIKKLAHLARIEVTEDEMAGYAQDLEAILGYVDQINSVAISDNDGIHAQYNVARADENPHVPGRYVEALLADAPATQDGFYQTPKIL